MTYYIPILRDKRNAGDMFCENHFATHVVDAVQQVMDWQDMGWEVEALLEWEPGKSVREMDLDSLIAAEEADREDEKLHGPQPTRLGDPWR